jgi:hypothetical protein
MEPDRIDYELANVAWKKLQRSPASTVAIFEMLARVSRLDLTQT